MAALSRAPLLAAEDFTDEFRSRLPPIVMMKGVFDLTHLGHVEALWGAREHGDCLVVAVAGDDAVRARKGPGRPVLSFRERAGIVANLRMVDYVVPYDEHSPYRVVAAVRPAFFCASHFDYFAAGEIADLRRSGIRLRQIAKPAEQSTSDIIRRIRGE